MRERSTFSTIPFGHFVKSDEVARGRDSEMSGPLPFQSEGRVQDRGESGDLGGLGLVCR